MKSTRDMEIDETYTIKDDQGIEKNLIITSKYTDNDGFLFVTSKEVMI